MQKVPFVNQSCWKTSFCNACMHVLWINEIPDYYADAKAGKKTLVTRIGTKRAADVYGVLMFSTYAAILLGVSLSLMPVLTLLSFLTAPLAIRAVHACMLPEEITEIHASLFQRMQVQFSCTCSLVYFCA